MTNELEKQFFDMFGIKPKLVESCTKSRHKCSERFVKDCSECPRAWRKYPQITDTHYLKLICELSKCKAFFNNFYRLQNVDIEQLKEQVLTDCIFQAIFFKDQVRTLFEEG